MTMLPIQVGLQAHEALQDRVITAAESAQMMTTVFNGVVGAMVIAFGAMMLSKALGSGSGNPGVMTPEIIARAGLKEYEYRWFPEPEEEVKPRVYPYTRRKAIGSYLVVMTRTDEACAIKLYEYLEKGKRKLRATWTGLGEAECDRKFEEVCEVIRQVRFEHKTALGR